METEVETEVEPFKGPFKGEEGEEWWGEEEEEEDLLERWEMPRSKLEMCVWGGVGGGVRQAPASGW